MQTDDSVVELSGSTKLDQDLSVQPLRETALTPVVQEHSDSDLSTDYEPIALHPGTDAEHSAMGMFLAGGLAIVIVPVLVWFFLVLFAMSPALLPGLQLIWNHGSLVILSIVMFSAAPYLLWRNPKKHVSLAPTHIAITPVGLFAKRGESRYGSFTVFDVLWGSVLRLTVETEGRRHQRNIVCFHMRDGSIKRFGGENLLGQKIRRQLIFALKEFGQHIEVEPELYALLGPASEPSYTEIWIDALTAPSQRRRVLSLEDGTIIGGGKYKILQSVGSGGQGTAYAAVVTKGGYTVVLKEYILPIHVRTEARKSALASLEKEVRLLERLNHPQIVKVLDFFVEDHRGYVVLEHVKGINLREVVQRDGPLSETRTIELARSMCEILSCLHSQIPPLIHLDFTPDNLIVQADGSLKLVDFNVAQYMDDTKSAIVVGKRAYMPPEQFRGKPPVTQSDLYAFGGCLFYLLTGEDPEPLSVLHPKALKMEVSDKLDGVIAKLTQLKFEDRYPTANAVLTELNEMSS